MDLGVAQVPLGRNLAGVIGGVRSAVARIDVRAFLNGYRLSTKKRKKDPDIEPLQLWLRAAVDPVETRSTTSFGCRRESGGQLLRDRADAFLDLEGLRVLAADLRDPARLVVVVETPERTAWCRGCGTQASSQARRNVPIPTFPPMAPRWSRTGTSGCSAATKNNAT